MVTFVDLRDSRISVLSDAARAWRELGREMTDLEKRVAIEVIRRLRTTGWSGAAAAVAFKRFDAIDEQFGLAALQSRTVTAVLDTAAGRLRNVQQRLDGALDAVAVLSLTVDDKGVVHPRPTEDGPEPLSPEAEADRQRSIETARIYTDLIAKLIAEATTEDAHLKKALDRLQPDRPGAMDPYEWKDAVSDARRAAELFGLDEADIPTDDPRAAAAWWQSLTTDQRQLYLVAYPERIGGLDGLPAVSRDEANRLVLEARLGELTMVSSWSRQNDLEEARLTYLKDRLEAARYGPAGEELLLLGLHSGGDGQAIVAVGNPDTARHTAVVVPGILTTLDIIGYEIDRATELQQAARVRGGPTAGDVSVIAWLGYDTPGADLDAVGHRRSEQGGDALDGFVDGLRAAHDSGPSHLTVLGHSYGSAVVGEAAGNGDGLAVDDIIVAGSPGMHVSEADDLNIDPRHVWAGEAEDDAISGFLGDIPGIHGPDPGDADFGGNRFHVDTDGHLGYWDAGSESLDNQARIIAGVYGDVTLDHGTAPQ